MYWGTGQPTPMFDAEYRPGDTVLSGWVEVYPAARVGAYIELRGGASANNRILLKLLRRIVLDGLAGLRIDAFRPIQVFDVLSSADEGAISAVQRVIKSVAGEMA